MNHHDCRICLFAERCPYKGDGCCEYFSSLYGLDDTLEGRIEEQREAFYKEWFYYIDENNE